MRSLQRRRTRVEARAKARKIRALSVRTKGVDDAKQRTRQAGGTIDRVRGRIREATGALSGSERQRLKGRARQDKGSARKKRGHLRDLLRK